MNEAEAKMRCELYNSMHDTNLTVTEYCQLDLGQLKRSDSKSTKRMLEVKTTASYDKNVTRKMLGK